MSEGGRDFLETLTSRAASRSRTLVFPEGTEPRVHEAVAMCVRNRVCRPVLIGAPADVRAGLDRHDVPEKEYGIVDPADATLVTRTLDHLAVRRAGKRETEADLQRMAEDPLVQGATMVALGEVDGGIGGCVRTTADVVRAGLVCIGLTEGRRTLSSSFYMVFGAQHATGPLVLTFTDAGVVPTPTARQLADIAVSAAGARTLVVGDDPRVAFLSYSTKGSADGPRITIVREALTRFREIMPDVPADGELQGDAALDWSIAQRKAPGSSVAGTANILVFPDLGAANIAYKLVQHLGGAVALGPILQGLARPFSDLSRGAVASDIVSVACITALMAE